MNQISFKLDVFEGPLDLLLKLITKHKLNIYDIEISKLLEQYLLYIDQCNEQNFELAGEFLEMAARLIYIKTASLLPKPEEAFKLKKELEGNLIEYSLCKYASERLKEYFTGNDIFVRKPTEIETDCTYNKIHTPDKLISAYMNMAYKKSPEEQQQIIENKINSAVKRKITSVISKVVFVLRKLYTTGEVYMESLYDGIYDRSDRVATFLAVLELTRNGRIKISDDNTKIYFTGRKKERRQSEQ